LIKYDQNHSTDFVYWKNITFHKITAESLLEFVIGWIGKFGPCL